MRWLLCAALWLAANMAGLYVAATTKWGPVVVVLSPNHGVHTGDIVAVLFGAAIASVVTGVVWASSSGSSPGVVARWMVCAAVWQLALVAALFVAATTNWGPVVGTWSLNHEVHLGDVLAVIVGVAIAGTVTVINVLLSTPRSARSAAPALHA